MIKCDSCGKIWENGVVYQARVYCGECARTYLNKELIEELKKGEAK